MKKKKESPLKGVRVPLPKKTGGPHSGKKGAKGYDRKQDKSLDR